MTTQAPPDTPKRKPRPPTARQEAIVQAVRELTQAGVKPSAVALASRLGVSRQGLRPQLEALEAKGLLRDVPVLVRSGNWELTPKALRLLRSRD